MSTLGFCPKCGSAGISREKRPNGYDVCALGCRYLSSEAQETPIIRIQHVALPEFLEPDVMLTIPLEETIKQRGEQDCFLCCIAMAAGMSYEALVCRIGDEATDRIQREGLYTTRINPVLRAAGILDEVSTVHLGVIDESAYGAVQRLLWGRRAIVQTPSLNFKGGQHMVYWDGDKLHDPSNKKCYRELEETEPVWLWLIHEKAGRR